MQKLGREPTDEEIAQQLGWPLARVKQVKNVAREPISLETPIGEEEDSSLGLTTLQKLRVVIHIPAYVVELDNEYLFQCL